eukprot:Blabericola_migrator_1__8001@NODE_4100_length_1334_cov_6_196527_g2533_i0_p2_GENE_NODE_4100_length_1334_cov_6_196527_g2533_i0NODE_4100_length_1334_cov_6_196527_g2533_i0_p2_ORF_typecomplete_len130_score9_87DUF975/PF06161_11/0_12_NODE_4100_length_1334_cov_6_196527_g2533_i0377766
MHASNLPRLPSRHLSHKTWKASTNVALMARVLYVDLSVMLNCGGCIKDVGASFLAFISPPFTFSLCRCFLEFITRVQNVIHQSVRTPFACVKTHNEALIIAVLHAALEIRAFKTSQEGELIFLLQKLVR